MNLNFVFRKVQRSLKAFFLIFRKGFVMDRAGFQDGDKVPLPHEESLGLC